MLTNITCTYKNGPERAAKSCWHKVAGPAALCGLTYLYGKAGTEDRIKVQFPHFSLGRNVPNPLSLSFLVPQESQLTEINDA